MNEQDATEDHLRRARPVPAMAWRQNLLRALRSRPLPPPRPEDLWIRVGVAAALGCVLLLIAALLI